MKNKKINNKIKSKKGFIFTVVIMLVLFVIVLAVSYYAKTIDEREQRAEEKFKFIAMGQILDMVSEEEISNFAEMSSFYALHSLDEHIIKKSRPLKREGTGSNKGTNNINKSIYELMTNGSVPSNYFNTGSEDFGYTGYTFREWGDKINSICAQLGYTCNISDIRNFSYTQNDSWSVNIYFEATTLVKSNDDRFNRTQDITVNRTYSIEGFEDAMVSILMKERSSGNDARKQIFRYKNLTNPTVSNIEINVLSDESSKGKGFFYGPIVDLRDIKITTAGIDDYYSDEKSGKYILQSKAPDWNVLTTDQKNTILGTYGAFIVTNVNDDCIEHNETGSLSSPQTYTVTVCRGTPAQTTKDITVVCQGVCNYQDCDATSCPFDCFDGLTGCNWRYDNIMFSGTAPTPEDCDGTSGLPFDFDGGHPVEEFKTHSDYATARDLLCGHTAIETSIPGLGAGSTSDEIEKPYLFYFSGENPHINVENPENYPLNVSDDFYGALRDREFVLINNEINHDEPANEAYIGYHELWDIDDMREMVMCGVYIETNESNEDGPSFFQRMVYEPEGLFSPDFGLETFVVGKYAGGADNPDDDNLCQLDRNFLNGEEADHLIKGMPGCNSFELTSTYEVIDDPVSEIGVGHFGLTDSIIEDYNLEDISCGGDRESARCN